MVIFPISWYSDTQTLYGFHNRKRPNLWDITGRTLGHRRCSSLFKLRTLIRKENLSCYMSGVENIFGQYLFNNRSYDWKYMITFYVQFTVITPFTLIDEIKSTLSSFNVYYFIFLPSEPKQTNSRVTHYQKQTQRMRLKTTWKIVKYENHNG